MIYKLTSFALFVALFSVGLAQNTVGTTVFQPDMVDDGYTLLYPHNQPHVYLLDFCGEVVHTGPTRTRCVPATWPTCKRTETSF